MMNMAMFDLPMYSEDHEKEFGYTNSLAELRDDLRKADGLLISVNEHNSNPSAYFKNLLDWLSRLELKFLENTKIFLMSTSPGKRGAISSLEKVKDILPRFGGEVVITFSLPSLHHNFKEGEGILDEKLAMEHRQALKIWTESLQS
jgi:NAD(P)H-dependent FMN reductase